mgnify:CR=1 FL=1
MSVLRACLSAHRRLASISTCERRDWATMPACLRVRCSPAPSPLFAWGGVVFLRVCACVVVGGRCFRGGYWRGVRLGFLVRPVLLRGAWYGKMLCLVIM